MKSAKTKPALSTLINPASKQKPRRATNKKPVKSVHKATNFADLDRLSQIYHVAAQLFCEHGYDATTMDDIANAVGITKAGVYFFISGGKQDLLYSIISYGMDRVEQAVIEPARRIADAEERLHSIILNHAQLITSRSVAEGFSPVTVAVDEMSSLSPAQRRKIIARKRAYLDLIRDTLQQLKDEDKLRDVDLTVAAFNILGMIMWLARWYRPDGKLTGEQVAEATFKMVMGGILQSPTRSTRK